MRCSATSLLSRWRNVVTLALLGLLSMALVGCASRPKQTWQDWERERNQNHEMPGPLPVSTALQQPVVLVEPYKIGDGAMVGAGFDLSMRNPDFPSTYIESIHVDLTSPHHAIRLVWTGSHAEKGPVGPWRSCPGRGKPGVDCDDAATSNVVDSFCTPKGVFAVAGFSDHLRRATSCHYATWVLHAPRYVAMHSHGDIATYPRSEGCIRLTDEVAKLIHNNSRAGMTLIHIDGKWTRGGE